jgi:nucleotide-binding universal stress UspA family protein
VRKQKLLIPLDGSDFSKQILPHIGKFFPPERYELIVMRVLSHAAMGQDDDSASLGRLATSIYTPMLARDSLSSSQKREHSPSSEDLQDAIAAQLKRELSPLQKAGYDLSVVSCFGEPVDEILRVIENKGVDLVAMATHGRTGLSRLVLGSVAEKILRRAPVPVFLVRPSKLATTAYAGELLAQQLKNNQALRLVFATDGSPQTEGAAIFTGNLARTFAPDVSLQLLVIVPDYQSVKYGQQVIAKTKELVGEVEPSPECVPLVGYAKEVIQEQLSLRDTDLLIISHFSEQTATKSSAIDTTVQGLVQHAPTSVIIAKGIRPAFKRILACTAIGDETVVEVAAQFAKKVGATLRLLHVLPTDSAAPLNKKQNYIQLDKALRDSKAGGYLKRSLSTLQRLGFEKETMVIRRGSAPNNILQEARTGRFDMIVVGSQSGPGHFLGSIANHVVRHAEQSVFVVRMT